MLVGLVPLFVLWARDTPQAAALHGLLAGLAYNGLLLSWVWYFGAVALFPLLLILAAVWALAGAAAVALSRRVPAARPLITAAVWVLAEALIARVPFGGFSWGEVGYALHDLPPARWMAALGGLPLVSLCAVLTNALIAQAVVEWGRRRAGAAPTLGARAWAGATVPLVVALVAGPVAVGTTEPDRTLRVASIQGNDRNRDLTPEERAARYLPASHFALADAITEPVDLIVFPESSMDADPRSDLYLRSEIRRIAADHRAWILANSVVDADPEGRRGYNQNVLFDPAGEVVATYAKRHLVPFGEYVPLRRHLGFIDALDQIPRDWIPGTEPPQVRVDGLRIVQEICFEIAFGAQVRRDVDAGGEIIVVSTNNRSYRRSANAAQHVAISQLRAAETGRPVVHAAISGITAVIDANGDIQAETRLFVNGVTLQTVTGRTGRTPYVRFGEWVLGFAALGIAAVVAASRRSRRLGVPAMTSVDSGADAGSRRVEESR